MINLVSDESNAQRRGLDVVQTAVQCREADKRVTTVCFAVLGFQISVVHAEFIEHNSSASAGNYPPCSCWRTRWLVAARPIQ